MKDLNHKENKPKTPLNIVTYFTSKELQNTQAMHLPRASRGGARKEDERCHKGPLH